MQSISLNRPVLQPTQISRPALSNPSLSLNSSDTLTLRFGATQAEIRDRFIRAANEGQLGAVLGYLRGYKVMVNDTDSQGNTALLSAALRNKAPIVKALLEARANFNQANLRGDTPLFYAATHPSNETLDLLLPLHRLNLNPQNREGSTPLQAAVLFNNPIGITKLLKAGANPNLQDNDGRTAVMTAIIHRKPLPLNALLQSQPKLDLKDNQGETAVHLATRLGYTEALQPLMNNNANLNLPDANGNTAAHLALLHNQYQSLDLLVLGNADLSIPNTQGKTVLDLAQDKNLSDRLANLIQQRDDRNAAYAEAAARAPRPSERLTEFKKQNPNLIPDDLSLADQEAFLEAFTTDTTG
jgi:ankyrin repeat protein